MKSQTSLVARSCRIQEWAAMVQECKNRPEGMSEKYFEKIYTLLNNLDSEKHAFDYTLEISEDDNIENPLAAKSFFKSNHIYNKFTICQLDTSKNSKIYVTGKK